MVNGFGYGWYGTQGFREIIAQWAQFGVFDILLPILLIFAVVFAILEKINLLKNQGVHLIIALVIGIYTISNPIISGFFLYLFSNLALGVAILLCLIVLLGIAIKPGGGTWKGIFTIGGIFIFLIVLAKSGAFQMLFGQNIGYWIQINSAILLLVLFIVLGVVFVLKGVKQEKEGFKVTPG